MPRRRHTEDRSVSRVSAAVNVNTTAHELIASARKHRASSRYGYNIKPRYILSLPSNLPPTNSSSTNPSNPLIQVSSQVSSALLLSSRVSVRLFRCLLNLVYQASWLSLFRLSPPACKVGWKDGSIGAAGNLSCSGGNADAAAVISVSVVAFLRLTFHPFLLGGNRVNVSLSLSLGRFIGFHGRNCWHNCCARVALFGSLSSNWTFRLVLEEQSSLVGRKNRVVPVTWRNSIDYKYSKYSRSGRARWLQHRLVRATFIGRTGTGG